MNIKKEGKRQNTTGQKMTITNQDISLVVEGNRLNNPLIDECMEMENDHFESKVSMGKITDTIQYAHELITHDSPVLVLVAPPWHHQFFQENYTKLGLNELLFQ